jgi:hypothetical protein
MTQRHKGIKADKTTLELIFFSGKKPVLIIFIINSLALLYKILNRILRRDSYKYSGNILIPIPIKHQNLI